MDPSRKKRTARLPEVQESLLERREETAGEGLNPPKAKETHPPPPKSRWPLSKRAREIWRETIGLVPDYIPLFENAVALYCSAREDLEQLDAELALKTLEPRLARQMQRYRRKKLRFVLHLAAELCLRPAARSELN